MESSLKMNHDETTITLIKSTRTLYNNRVDNYKGKPCIGWEHELTKYDLKSKDSYLYLSLEASETLLIKDLVKIDKYLSKYLNTTKLSQKQYNALVSLCYDVGTHHVKVSGILDLINRSKYVEASNKFRIWNTYLKERLYKLTKLRKIEIELFTKN